jgi:hypothetical protein
LTTGLMGRLGLYILIRPLMEGADGFMLTYEFPSGFLWD